MANRPIRISILANSRPAIKSVGKFSKVLQSLGKLGKTRLKELSTGLVKIGTYAAAAASAVGPLSVAMLKVVKGLSAVGKGLASLAPLAAFVPALAGGFALVKLTLMGFAEAATKALSPVTDTFKKLQQESAKLAVSGIKPLAREFVKLNFPAVRRGMDSIARSTNKAAKRLAEWLNSAKGVRFIRDVVDGTSAAFDQISGKVTTATLALLNMASRADVKKFFAGLADIVSTGADKFTKWANGVTRKDIQKALDNLKNAVKFVVDKFKALREAITWLSENQGKIKAFSDAIATAAIVIGIAVGAWPAVIGGAVTLILNHFDVFKGGLTRLKAKWDEISQGLSRNSTFTHFTETIRTSATTLWNSLVDAFNKIRDAVAPVFKQIGDVIQTDLVPALDSFIQAVTPIAKFLIDTLGPVVATVFSTALKIIKNALKIIAGVLNVFAGVLTGDWRKAWNGIKQIFSGAIGAIGALLSGLKSLLGSGLRAAIDTIKGVFGGARRLLVNIGRDIINGLWDGLKAQWRSVKDWFGSITSEIPKLKGPASKDRRLLVKNGKLVMGGFKIGLESVYGSVKKSLRRFTKGIGTRNDFKVLKDALGRGLKALIRKIQAQKQVVADLKKARDDYAKSVATSLKSGGITSIDLVAGVRSFQKDFLIDGLKNRLAAIKRFQRDLATLRKRGLSADLIRQIADAGLETGGKYLAALRDATPSYIRQINTLNRAINRTANATGAQAANDVFGARITNANKLVVENKLVLKLDTGGNDWDKAMITALRKAVRAGGGNVQVVLGR